MDQFQVFLFGNSTGKHVTNLAANAVTIFIVESLLKAVHDCIDRVQIARPIIFFEHPNQRDDQAELCQLKKFCLSSEQDHVFRQFTAGNDML